MTLIIKKIELRSFYDRWLIKANSYHEENLKDYFDKFFTLFVVYNRIYNVIVPVLKESGQLEVLKANKSIRITKHKIEPNDFESATICVTCFFKPSIDEFLDEIREEKNQFESIIEDEQFYIDVCFGKPQRAKDLSLLKDLKSKDNEKILEAVLKIIYKIRCNMFHGEKGFDNDQKIILKPANSIMEKINNALIDKVTD